MQLRTLLTLVNFATIAAAVAVLLAYPQWAGYAFYILLGWMFVSLALIYSPWANRRVGPAASAGPGLGVSPDAPLSAGSGHEHASSIGFCMYCAAPLEPGTARCPACGRSLPHFS
ncbi:MAG: hypothetical protein L3J68_00785 [Thermoplasmata archaeon]|nr:hypothetical protein [Thermoplasmata archaeon]